LNTQRHYRVDGAFSGAISLHIVDLNARWENFVLLDPLGYYVEKLVLPAIFGAFS
jgi:hypothetical protein